MILSRRQSQPDQPTGVLARIRRAVTPQNNSAESGDVDANGSSRKSRFSRPSDAKDSPVRETTFIDKMVDNNGNKILNQYLLLETVGQGRHGKVKRCIDTDTGNVYVRFWVFSLRVADHDSIGHQDD